MKIQPMTTTELIREVKRLDKELPVVIWEEAFEGFDSPIWDLNDNIENWNIVTQEHNEHSSSDDYVDMVYKALENKKYPAKCEGYVRSSFETILEKLEQKIYDEEIQECANKIKRLIDFKISNLKQIRFENKRTYTTITDKDIMNIIKQRQKDNGIIYHFEELSLYTLELSIFYKVKELIKSDDRLVLVRIYDEDGGTNIEVKEEAKTIL